jgi:hypothetical protein
MCALCSGPANHRLCNSSDKWSRVNSLLVSTIILLVFTALCAGSYYHGDAVGMFNILTAWRFFVSHPGLSQHMKVTLNG